jgi:hypothetical protein
MDVLLRGPFADVSLIDAMRATPDERAHAMTRGEAALWLRTLDDRVMERVRAARLDLAAPCWPSIGQRSVRRAQVRCALTEALTSGWVIAVRRERGPRVLLQPLDDEEPLGPDDAEKLRVDFFFDYADGTAVHDLAYVLQDSGGSKTPGKLPKDGSIARDHAAGTYTVSLKEIDVLQWQPARIRCAEQAKVLARVTGIDDGAQGTVRVYRLFDEDEKAALATLQATVNGGTLEAAWTPGAKAMGDAPDDDGLARCVAELSFEGGTIWRKTEPLAVELPAIVGAEWSAADADAGHDVALVVRTTGFADGAQVKATLVAHDVLGDDRPLGDAPHAAVAGGAATLAFTAGDGILQALAYDVIAKIAVEGGGAKATACSTILRVHPAPCETDGSQGVTDAPA